MIWDTASSQSCFCSLYRASPSLAAKNIINLILVSTVWWCPCVVFSCVVGRGCLLWPVHSLGKTLLAFDLLHFVLQGQICLLLQISLDFLLLHLESHLEFAFFKNHLQVFSIFSVVTQRKESYFLFLILRGHKAGYLFNFLFPLTSRNYFKVSGFYLFIYLNSILFIYFFWSSENFFKSFYFIYKELVLFSA